MAICCNKELESQTQHPFPTLLLRVTLQLGKNEAKWALLDHRAQVIDDTTSMHTGIIDTFRIEIYKVKIKSAVYISIRYVMRNSQRILVTSVYTMYVIYMQKIHSNNSNAFRGQIMTIIVYKYFQILAN